MYCRLKCQESRFELRAWNLLTSHIPVPCVKKLRSWCLKKRIAFVETCAPVRPQSLSLVVLAQDLSDPVSPPSDYALGKDCIMHGFMLKLGNPFLTQWQRRYFYLFPNRLEWRGEGESRVSSGGGTCAALGCWGSGALGLPHTASCLCPLCLRSKGCYGLTFSVCVKFLPGIKTQMSFERQSPECRSLTESMEAGERNGGMGEEQSRRGQSQLMARRTQHTPRCLSGPQFPH